jgi:hypothetical protein
VIWPPVVVGGLSTWDSASWRHFNSSLVTGDAVDDYVNRLIGERASDTIGFAGGVAPSAVRTLSEVDLQSFVATSTCTAKSHRRLAIYTGLQTGQAGSDEAFGRNHSLPAERRALPGRTPREPPRLTSEAPPDGRRVDILTPIVRGPSNTSPGARPSGSAPFNALRNSEERFGRTQCASSASSSLSMITE